MDIKDIKDLILTIDKTSINQVEIEKEDMKINIYKSLEKRKDIKSSNQEALIPYEKDTDYTDYIEDIVIEESYKDDFTIAKSPIVGVYYSASSPNAEAFVKKGQKVKKGDILCIIEAMKIMNEILAEEDGEVTEIYAQDEDMIQYGQALIKLRRI